VPESRRRQTTSAEPESAEPESAEAESIDERDELKRRFREALDRKHNRESEAGASGDGKDPSKVHGTHGPAASRRAFRRKSG
jgi:hypothetical protein